MLDDYYRADLAELEAWHREVLELTETVASQRKRLARLRSAKHSEPAARELADNQTRLDQLVAYIDRGTTELFRRAFNIEVGSVVTLRDAHGLVHGCVQVQDLRARQLTSGKAVLAVSGHAQPLPAHAEAAPNPVSSGGLGMLLAAEAEGKYLKREA